MWKRVTAATVMTLVMASSAAAQADRPWSVSFSAGTAPSVSGIYHEGGSGTVLNLPTDVQERNYSDIYNAGFAMKLGLGYGFSPKAELIGSFTYARADAEELSVGSVAGLGSAIAVLRTSAIGASRVGSAGTLRPMRPSIPTSPPSPVRDGWTRCPRRSACPPRAWSSPTCRSTTTPSSRPLAVTSACSSSSRLPSGSASRPACVGRAISPTSTASPAPDSRT